MSEPRLMWRWDGEKDTPESFDAWDAAQGKQSHLGAPYAAGRVGWEDSTGCFIGWEGDHVWPTWRECMQHALVND